MKYSNKEKLSIVARCQQGESVAALSNEACLPHAVPYIGGSNLFLRTVLESR